MASNQVPGPGRRRLVQSIGGVSLALAGGSLLSGCAGAALSLGQARGEPPLETTRIRMAGSPSLCHAPRLIAEPLLRAEGVTDVQYVEPPPGRSMNSQLTAGELDITSLFSAPFILTVDAGDPVGNVAAPGPTRDAPDRWASAQFTRPVVLPTGTCVAA